MHNLEPNANSLSLDPFLLRLNRHSPVSRNVLIVRCDSSSLAGCIKIHPMPSALHYDFNNFGLSGSNMLRNGEEVTPTLVCGIK